MSAALQATVARLLARAGTPVRLLSTAAASYDPQGGTVAAPIAEHEVTGVVETVEAGHADGVVLRGDRMLLLAAEPLPLPPAPGDGVLLDGAVHRVLSVATTLAGDRPLLFRLHLRR